MKLSTIKKVFILFICIICFNFLFKAEGAQRIVRIGCLDIDNFLEIDSYGNVSGYGAEYLKRISEFTGWTYEYKQGSWEECMEWLKEGKIDILMPAEYSEERAKDYLFSDVECCLDYVALVGRKYDNNYYYEDYEAFDGMSVGMIKGNYLNAIFEQYASEQNFSFSPIYYNSGISLSNALEEGKVNAIVNGNLEFKNTQKMLAKINYMPAYFITSINNPELMKELNEVLHQIFLHNPYYTADLHSKYYESIERQYIGFTRQEANYIKEKGEITVLLEKNNYPMEWYDNDTDNFKGIYADIIRLIEKENGLSFRFIVNDTKNSAIEEVKDGKADVWGSAYEPNVYNKSNDIVYSTSYYENNYCLVGKKEKNINSSDLLTIGVQNCEIGIINSIKKYYPNWNLILYDDMKNCFESVRQSKTDLLLVNSRSLSMEEYFLGSDLIVIDSNILSLPICFAVPQESDKMLISVLNKAILKMDRNELQECGFNSILSIKETISFINFIKKYPIYVINTFIVLIILICTALFVFYRSAVHKKQNKILHMKNLELAEAVNVQEQLRKETQTDSLTGLKNKGTIEYACQNYLNLYPDKTHAIFVMDLDNFKNINDTYGHLGGDAILKQFGRILLKSSDDNDIVGRIGGDEFLMFMACVENQSQIESRVEQLYKNMKESAKELPEVPIRCSIGILISTGSYKEFKELFLRADQALYQAKNDGKNKYVVITE